MQKSVRDRLVVKAVVVTLVFGLLQQYALVIAGVLTLFAIFKLK